MTIKKLPAVVIYKSTQDRGEELRYTLRGLDNIINWNGEVFIVGDREDWFSPEVNFIEMQRGAGRKHRDVYLKIRKIISTVDIPDEFIFLNDDFFCTRKVEIVPMHQGPLKRYTGHSRWLKTKSATRNLLRSKFGVDEPLDYSIHTPIIFEKDKLKTSLDIVEAQHPDYEISLRSVYGNLNRGNNEKFYKDGKFKWDKAMTSSGSESDLVHIKALLPHPSRFEVGGEAESARYTTTVIMPMWNEAKRLEKAISSIPDWVDEILACDDGSSDGTLKKLRQLAKKNSRLRVLFNKKNKGIGETVNKLIDNVQTDYYTQLDGDDYYLPAMQKMETELTGEDIVFFDWKFKSGKIRKITESNYRQHSGCNRFVKKSALGELRTGGERVDEDKVFYNKFLKTNPSVKFTGLIAYYRNYPREGSLCDLKNKQNGR